MAQLIGGFLANVVLHLGKQTRKVVMKLFGHVLFLMLVAASPFLFMAVVST